MNLIDLKSKEVDKFKKCYALLNPDGNLSLKLLKKIIIR